MASCPSAAVFDDSGRKMSPGSESRSTSAGTSSQSMSNQRPALPDIEYPAPFVIKNTFIDTTRIVQRLDSLEDFLVERKVKSCPASGIAGSANALTEDACDVSSAAKAIRRTATAPLDSIAAVVALASAVAATNACDEVPPQHQQQQNVGGCQTPSSSWGSQNSCDPPVKWEVFSGVADALSSAANTSPAWYSREESSMYGDFVPQSGYYETDSEGNALLYTQAFEQYRVPQPASEQSNMATSNLGEEAYCMQLHAPSNAGWCGFGNSGGQSWDSSSGPSRTWHVADPGACQQFHGQTSETGDPYGVAFPSGPPVNDCPRTVHRQDGRDEAAAVPRNRFRGSHAREQPLDTTGASGALASLLMRATAVDSMSSTRQRRHDASSSVMQRQDVGQAPRFPAKSNRFRKPRIPPNNGNFDAPSVTVDSTNTWYAANGTTTSNSQMYSAYASPGLASSNLLSAPPPSQPPLVGTSFQQHAMPPPPPPPPLQQQQQRQSVPTSSAESSDEGSEKAVIRLSDALPVLGTEQVPSIGSEAHNRGGCRPCAFFHTRGCENADGCPFCHLCVPGEKKRRLREKRVARREAKEAKIHALQAAQYAEVYEHEGLFGL